MSRVCSSGALNPSKRANTFIAAAAAAAAAAAVAAAAGRMTPKDSYLVAKVDVAGRVDKVEEVPIVKHARRLRLHGDAPVALDLRYDSGVVWRGVAWCGVVWCGVVWCGVMWCVAV